MDVISSFDREMMARALQLAAHGLNSTTPNPRVGCVIVGPNHEILGEGYHKKAGEAHAEINALAEAGEKASGATVYVTLEPCSHYGKTPPCADALVNAGVARVVYAMEDPNPEVAGRGLERLQDAGVRVDGPLLEDEAVELNRGFIKRMRRGLPYVRCKMAMSLDGRTAMANGQSKWVTGPGARNDVQAIRARSCAIVTGVGTVVHDEPALTVRLGDDYRQPLRVIVDTHARSPISAEIFQQTGQTIIATSENTKIAEDDPRKYWFLKEREKRVDLHQLTRKLASEGCNEILVEAGATLAGAYLSSGLVDELVVYMAPKLMGSSARPLFDLPIQRMTASLSLSITDIRAVGNDWRITAMPDPEG